MIKIGDPMPWIRVAVGMAMGVTLGLALMAMVAAG